MQSTLFLVHYVVISIKKVKDKAAKEKENALLELFEVTSKDLPFRSLIV